jgi:AraC-like DNA-binding protein
MDWRVSKLKDAIDSNAGGVAWNLKRACQELGLGISPAYAGQLFKRHFGLSVREYAKKLRLQQALERLTRTELPIKVIAGQLGYREASNFTRFFRDQRHQTPTKSREPAA